LSRILFRLILEQHGISDSGPWWIEHDSKGKPFANSVFGRASFHLNTTDTNGMIGIVVSRSGPVGCDIEGISNDYVELASSHFTPRELADYQSKVGFNKRRRFFEIWTLKEALLKADGRGLAVPLTSFSFRFQENRKGLQPHLQIINPSVGPHLGPWQIHSFCPLPTFQAALVIKSSNKINLEKRVLSLKQYDLKLQKPWIVNYADTEGKPTERKFGILAPGDKNHASRSR
jgi:phosphopantetheinyl transferase (holo-ACP synthase)